MNYIFIFLAFIFIGCSSIPSVEQRVKTSNDLIKEETLKKEVMDTSTFSLYSLQKVKTCQKVRVYIEGDGLSWISRTKISSNPTPINPLALKLFLKDESSCKIYLARPCQYTSNSICEKKYWTSHRYSQKVLDSYLSSFEKLKKRYKNKKFELIGFSGGAAISLLLAGNRDDISHIITVAGNIDHVYWTKKHKISPLYGSLNPLEFKEKLANIKQVHLIGEEDKIIDESIFDAYSSHFLNNKNVKKVTFKNFSHQKGWENNWKKILSNQFIWWF